MSDTRKNQNGTATEGDKRAAHESAHDSSPGTIHEAIRNQLKTADASLQPFADTLTQVERTTRETAGVLQQGVKGIVDGIDTVSDAKNQFIEKGLETGARAINDTHVLDGAKPAINDALHRVDAALEPLHGDLQTGNAMTGAAAKAVEQVATTTHLKDVAEVISAGEDIYSLKHVVSKVGDLAKDAPHGVGHAEPHGAKRPFKGPDVTPRLVESAEPTRARLVTTDKPVDIEASIEKSRVTSGSEATAESTRPYAHKQGNFGERIATDALHQQGHTILDTKPDIQGTTRGGIDIVTMKEGTVYAIDNKAFTTGRDVSSVSALEKNFDKNVKAVREQFANYAKDTSRSPNERALFTQAVEAIDAGRVQKAVTTAAHAADGKMSSGIGLQLQSRGFLHIDVMPQGNHGAPSGRIPAVTTPRQTAAGGTVGSNHIGDAQAGESRSGAAPRPAATQTSPKPGGPSGVVPRPAATQTSPKSGGPSGVVPRPAATQASPNSGVAGSLAGSGGTRPAVPSQAGASTASPTGAAVSGGAAGAGQMGGAPSGSNGVWGPNSSGSFPNGAI